MSVNYPDSEWEIIDGVRYRKTAITPKESKVVKTKEVKKKKVEPISPEP